MDKTTFDSLYIDAHKCLSEQRMNDAIAAIGGLMLVTGSREGFNGLTELRESYSMMLDYMERGFQDPERDRMFRRFQTRAYELTDLAYREFLLADKSTHYASLWNILVKLSQPVTLSALADQGGAYRQLFEVAWTGPIWQKEDYEAAHRIVQEGKWKMTDCAVLVSGVTLGVMQIFDAFRLRFLLDLAVHPDLVLRVRALTGVVLCYMRYQDRVKYYSELEAQLRMMVEFPDFIPMLCHLQTLLFLSLETKDYEKHLREDIMPSIMKRAKDLPIDKSLGLQELEQKLSEQEFNPEWQKDKDISKIVDKLNEMAEMQKKGGDVYIGSFKHIKLQQPFFSVAANWFCPFYFNHPDLSKPISSNKSLRNMVELGTLCDSDKYTLSLMLSQMTSDPMMSFLNGQVEMGMTDEVRQQRIEELDANRLFNTFRSYIQDIYRFFTLFRDRKGIENPFKWNLLLSDYTPFGDFFSNETVLQELAEFTFKEKSYLYALHFFEHLPETAANCQKAGFCYQSVGDYQSAASAYEKAILLASDNQWTLRQLGRCYRALGDFEKALRYYEDLEQHTPDDVNLLLMMGEAYISIGAYDKAFEKLYKADYLSEQRDTALRALAWCSLLAGKYEQACTYYDKILSKSPTEEDYLNAGHAYWLSGNVPEAVTRYRERVKLMNLEIGNWNFFGDDAKVLLERGISPLDLRLMTDLLDR